MVPFVSAAAMALALQSAPAAEPVQAPLALDALPIEQSAAPRCGIVFALVNRWRQQGDPRAARFADVDGEQGREFFVRSMARLMEDRELTREQVSDLVLREVARLDDDAGADRIAAMMPACRLFIEGANP